MPDQVIFVRTKNTVYAIRVTPDGHVRHLGHRPTERLNLTDLEWLDAFNGPSPNLEEQGQWHELLARGDVHSPEHTLRVAFSCLPKPLEPGEERHLPVRDLRLRYQSHAWVTEVEPACTATHPHHQRSKSPTLRIDLKDEYYAFTVSLFYRPHAESDVIERWATFTNDSQTEAQIERLGWATQYLPLGGWNLTSFGGTWAREFQTTRRPLETGTLELSNRGLNTGWRTNPGYILTQNGQSTTYFGALVYGGGWSLRFETLPTGSTRIHVGAQSEPFALTLPAGATHTTPSIALGVTNNGVGGASQCLHQFVRERILPTSSDVRPVLFNSWEATGFKLGLDQQVKLAQTAARIGVELFTVDDGWFGGRRDDHAGLGDWQVSPEVFPEGMRPLADEVHRLGMKFGLWFEPEMVNPDSELYRAHPEWVLHTPGRPRQTVRNQLVLDFGRPEAVEHILNEMRSRIREIGVDFIKWDMNRYVMEDGSVAGTEIFQRHIEAVYRIIDTLRTEFPGLEFEACSAGGGRADLGMFQRAEQAWTSDNTDAVDRVAIQEGYSHLYPPRTMECWVTEQFNGLSGRTLPLSFRFDVAMRGALGVGSNLGCLSDQELDDYSRYIAFYKTIRPIVQKGTLYRLMDEAISGVSVWQTVSDDGLSSVVSSVQTRAVMLRGYPMPVLVGLDADRRYRISTVDGVKGTLAGAQLMSFGLPSGPKERSWWQSTHACQSMTVLLEAI